MLELTPGIEEEVSRPRVPDRGGSRVSGREQDHFGLLATRRAALGMKFAITDRRGQFLGQRRFDLAPVEDRCAPQKLGHKRQDQQP